MKSRRGTNIGMLALVLLCGGRVAIAQTAPPAPDTVSRARELATAGRRGEAIALLQASLAAGPNNDARVLLGTVFSWEGRHDEARRELAAVLAESPAHGDALRGLINVELWSNHPGRADELASRALQDEPNDVVLLLARARAQSGLERHADARDTLDRLLAIDPQHEDARQMRRGVSQALRPWQIRLGSSYEGFSHDRASWREAHAMLTRSTPVGPVSIRGVRAQRFGLKDDQIEVESYPRFRPGTYAYVSAAYAPRAVFFPEQRYAADLYQRLGGGFEGSAGFRWIGFGSGVKIYVGSLSKHSGNWLMTGRAYINPGPVGTSRAYHATIRRYVGDTGSFVGLRYGRGASREEVRNRDDLDIVDSDVGAVDATLVVRRRIEVNAHASYGREDRRERRNMRQYSFSTAMGFRF